MNSRTSVRDVATTMIDEVEHNKLLHASEALQGELSDLNKLVRGKKGKARNKLLEQKQKLE